MSRVVYRHRLGWKSCNIQGIKHANVNINLIKHWLAQWLFPFWKLHRVIPGLYRIFGSWNDIFSCDYIALWMVQSVRLSHTYFDYVPIIISTWNSQEFLSMTEVMSIQKVKVID